MARLWQESLNKLLLLWVIISVFLRPGWLISLAGLCFWIALVYLTAPGVFWYDRSFFILNYLKSTEALEKAITYRPLIPGPYKSLGLIYLKQEKWQEAIDPLEKAIALSKKNHPDLKLSLAVAYRKSTRNQDALRLMTELHSQGVETLALYYQMAASLLQEGRLEEALNATEKARSLDPSATDPVLLMGRIHFLMEDFETAQGDFEWAISRLSWPVESYYWLGRAKYELGNYQGAVEDLRLAVERITDDPLLSDISVEEAKRRLDQALRSLEDSDR